MAIAEVMKGEEGEQSFTVACCLTYEWISADSCHLTPEKGFPEGDRESPEVCNSE